MCLSPLDDVSISDASFLIRNRYVCNMHEVLRLKCWYCYVVIHFCSITFSVGFFLFLLFFHCYYITGRELTSVTFRYFCLDCALILQFVHPTAVMSFLQLFAPLPLRSSLLLSPFPPGWVQRTSPFFFFFFRITFSHCAYRTAPVGVQVLWPCAVTIHSMCLQRNPLTVLLFAFTLSLSLSNKQPGFVSLSQRDSNVSLRGGHSPTPNPQPEQPGYPF